MRKFKVVIFKQRTLVKVSEHVIMAESMDKAREAGIARFQVPGTFTTATPHD